MVALGLGLTLSATRRRRLAQAPAGPPVFTAAQAAAGRTVYAARCAGCHLADLQGRNEAAPLAGANFMNAWRGRTAARIVQTIQSTMPPGAAGTLGADDYLNVTAFCSPPTARQPARNRSRDDERRHWQRGDGHRGNRQRDQRGRQAAPPPAPRGQGSAGRRAGRRDPRRRADISVAGRGARTTCRSPTRCCATPPAGDWLMARRNYQAWSHSPLTEITRANVKDLRLAWSWSMNEGGANQTDAARAQRHHVSRQHHEHGAGPGRRDRRPDLGEPGRPEPGHRLRLDAQHRDLPGQGLPRDDRCAARWRSTRGRAKLVWTTTIADRTKGFSNTSGPIVIKGHGGAGPAGLRPLPRRALHDQRLRRRHRQAALEVLHHRAHGRARRRHVGHAARHDAAGRRDVDCRQLRSRPRPHLLGRRAGQAVDAGQPRHIDQGRRALRRVHRGAPRHRTARWPGTTSTSRPNRWITTRSSSGCWSTSARTRWCSRSARPASCGSSIAGPGASWAIARPCSRTCSRASIPRPACRSIATTSRTRSSTSGSARARAPKAGTTGRR